MDLPKKYEVLLGNTESTLIERAYAINNPDVVVNSTYIERSKPKRSKTSKVDMNKLNQMVTYIYMTVLSQPEVKTFLYTLKGMRMVAICH